MDLIILSAHLVLLSLGDTIGLVARYKELLLGPETCHGEQISPRGSDGWPHPGVQADHLRLISGSLVSRDEGHISPLDISSGFIFDSGRHLGNSFIVLLVFGTRCN